MPGSPRTRGKRRFGYDGCLTDLIVFVLIGVAALWGIHRWNALPRRPLGLPAVPLPHLSQILTAPARRWAARGQGSPPPPAPPEATPIPAFSPSPPPATPTPPTPTPAPLPTASPAAPPPSLEATASISKLVPKVTASADPLSAPATTLEKQGATLYLGLSDGGMAIRSGESGKGVAVRLPQPAGAVTSIAAGGDGNTVYWLAAGSGTRVYSYRTREKALRAYDLPAEATGDGVAAFEAVAMLPERSGRGETIALLGNGVTSFFDATSGQMRTAAEVLPAEAAAMLDHPATSLFVARAPAEGGRIALLIVSGDGVAPGSPALLGLWTSRGGDWLRQEIDAASVPAFSALRYRDAGRAAIALTVSGVGLLTPPAGGQTLAAGRVWTTTWPGTGDGNAASLLSLRPYSTLPDGISGLWAPPDRVSLGKSGLWWTFGSSVFHTSLPAGATEAYLPWNGAGTKRVSALLADDAGAWVATEKGVRHIALGKPPAANGYGGYVRARLGPSTGQPPTESKAMTLARLTTEWSGVPYKWGGDDRKGIDCSGYLCALYRSVGISVPRATNELNSGADGTRIHDELKYGDVLGFPGHCALYVGNGWTSEAMKETGVGKATIWSRTPTVVRRFLR